MTLQGAEAHHLATVCRLRQGDAVCLFNGDGNEYSAHITDVGRRAVTLQIESMSTPMRELAFSFVVAAPLPKGDRAQFLVEKLTELGVSTLVPLATDRSVFQPREAKLDKLQRWVIEASKQCGRNTLMQIAVPQAWTEYCALPGEGEQRWLAHPGGKQGSDCQLQLKGVVRVAVGPEGGLTDAEVAAGLASGWQLISLGPRVLRIETAALALASWASLAASGSGC